MSNSSINVLSTVLHANHIQYVGVYYVTCFCMHGSAMMMVGWTLV